MTDDRINLIGTYATIWLGILVVSGLLFFMGRAEHKKSMAAIERGVVWAHHSETGYRPAEKLPRLYDEQEERKVSGEH